MSRNYTMVAISKSSTADGGGLTRIFSRRLQTDEAFRSWSRARRILRVVALAILALGVSVPAVADTLTYTFNINTSGGLDPFTFSFTTPTFLTSDQSITFTPFVITNGTTSWTIDQGQVSTPNCFEFATTSDGIILPCGAGVGGTPPGAGMLLVLDASTLPTATGIYAIDFAIVIFDPGGSSISTDSTLDITSTTSAIPEPASIVLMGIGAALIGWRLSMRRGDSAGERRLDAAC